MINQSSNLSRIYHHQPTITKSTHMDTKTITKPCTSTMYINLYHTMHQPYTSTMCIKYRRCANVSTMCLNYVITSPCHIPNQIPNDPGGSSQNSIELKYYKCKVKLTKWKSSSAAFRWRSFREKWSPDDEDISSWSFIKKWLKWWKMVGNGFKKCNLGLWELNPRPC